MRTRGMGAIVPAVHYIAPNPVMAEYNRRAAIVAAAEAEKKGMAGLGCGNDGFSGYNNVGWAAASSPEGRYMQQGRDVLYSDVSLAGMGDFAPAAFSVPQNPIAGNAILNGLAGLQGIDVTSLSAFQTSVMDGKSFGVSNLILVAGAAAVAFFLFSGSGGGFRRR